MTTPQRPLFDGPEALRQEIADALLVAALPAVQKETYRDQLKLAGDDVGKLTMLLTRLRARARHSA
jgi:hypothetical protein